MFERAPQDLLCAVAAVSIALALLISDALFQPVALVLATLGAASAVIAARSSGRGRAPRAAFATLAVGLVASLVVHCVHGPILYPTTLRWMPAFLWLARVSLVCALVAVAPPCPARVRRGLFIALCGAFALMAVLCILSSAAPLIDVFIEQQMSAEALVRGLNPYSITFPNIYSGFVPYDPSLLNADNRITAFAYLPLNPLLGAPFFAAFGDMRFALVLEALLGAVLFARGGGGLAWLAMVFSLLNFRFFFILENAYTEPLVFCCAAIALTGVLASREGRWALAGIGLGLLLGSKQYAFLIAIPCWLAVEPAHRLKVALLAAVTLAIPMLPFAVIDLRAFLHGVVESHLRQPLRLDCLSWMAAVARVTGRTSLPGAPAWLLGVSVLVFAAWKRTILTPAQAAAAGGASWLAVVLFSKQASANYFWLVLALFCAAVALLDRKSSSTETPATSDMRMSTTAAHGA